MTARDRVAEWVLWHVGCYMIDVILIALAAALAWAVYAAVAGH